MSKFKAGDKVRLVKASKPKYWHIDMIGETFTLERKDKYLGWYLEGGNYNVLQEEDIELVQEEKESIGGNYNVLHFQKYKRK